MLLLSVAHAQLLHGVTQSAGVDGGTVNPPNNFLNFATNQALTNGTPATAASLLTVVRSNGGTHTYDYANDTGGTWYGFTQNTPRITNNGLLVEEARTNSIRNNSMQGAVPGTPGTLPTNWSFNTLSGLTQTIVGTGTQNGIDYVDINFAGTTNSTFLNLFFEGNVIAAAIGQTWTESIFIAIVGGTTTNVTVLNLGMSENNAGGSLLANDSGSNILSSITPILTRFNLTATLGQATTAFLQPWIGLNFNNASAVNITYRIGWPQLELGAFVTSPIRTTSAAVTRAADAVTLTTPPTFGAAYSVFAQGVPQAPIAYALNQVLLSADDTTFANAVRMWRPSGGATGYQIRVSNVPTGTGSTGWVQNASGKLAAAFAAADQTAYFGGVSQGTTATSPLPSGLNTVVFGNTDGTAQFWNGFIQSVAIWSSQRVPNAQLQSMTQ
jgi:hypothetical protein